MFALLDVHKHYIFLSYPGIFLNFNTKTQSTYNIPWQQTNTANKKAALKFKSKVFIVNFEQVFTCIKYWTHCTNNEVLH